MQKADRFSTGMADKHGFIPDNHTPFVVGHVVTHSGNSKRYAIIGFAWMGATDEWGFVHVSPEGVTCVRPIHHLWGLLDDGTLRYTFAEGIPCPHWYAAPDKEDYTTLLNATADVTDALSQVPDRLKELPWWTNMVVPAVLKVAKAVGHKVKGCTTVAKP